MVDRAPFAFDHAWCTGADAYAIDPSLPDGTAVAYLGLPFATACRQAQQAVRGTYAVLTVDTYGIFANDAALRDGLPPDALADLGLSLDHHQVEDDTGRGPDT